MILTNPEEDASKSDSRFLNACSSLMSSTRLKGTWTSSSMAPGKRDQTSIQPGEVGLTR